MKNHFVTFYSPGTFYCEDSEYPISSWDIPVAVDMARDICERHGARPFGFRFSTRERGENDLDSKVSKKSGMHYLGGKIETLSEVERRATKEDRILLDNMRVNGWNRIITNTNSWMYTGVFHDEDVLLDVTLTPRKNKESV